MTERQLYILDKFHLNQLTADEKKEFDAFLEDPEFHQMIDIGKDLGVVIQKGESNILKEKIDQWENDIAIAHAKKHRLRIGVFILIGLVVLSLIGRMMWQRNKPDSNEQLFYAYLEPYPNITAQQERSLEDNSTLKQAIRAYEQSAFNEAISLFESIPASNSTEGAQFYLAISYLMEERIENAKSLFLELTNSKKYGLPSTWYLFLIAIKQDDQPAIENYRQKLTSQETHPRLAIKTKELLNK